MEKHALDLEKFSLTCNFQDKKEILKRCIKKKAF